MASGLLFFLFASVVVWSGGEYVDPNQIFRLKVPVGYRVATGTQKPSDSYIPVCQNDSAVCFEYPAHSFPGTTFGSAPVEVTILKVPSETACTENAKANSQSETTQPAKVIDGIKFLHRSFLGAAMSDYGYDQKYLGFDKGKCFRLKSTVTYTEFKAYDPGTIKEFTGREQTNVEAELERIVVSFRALNR